MADVTDQNFQSEVLESKIPVLVDFWAPWCAPCRIVSPTVDRLGEEYKDKMKVLKLNVDDNTQTASNYGVMSIPTLLIFKNGQPLKTIVGAQPRENIKRAIDETISSV